ncbi:MAG: phosphoenolpyruvate synthase [Candidatus Diapherotrites archaeon]|uniref:pyruvate, water dikinase n=1 Tax=Candidatus Iainarchaeum sp. TaxID=3101447 RepID=A0A2D6M1C4_9ARCH|nr:phosphoenolpyruvate synthase [Candidatus Diapherotrites archaeon]|tara:strand:- start:812 stop:3406 length:2595 start_codon:yes stop_codon:yes gene_type:complete
MFEDNILWFRNIRKKDIPRVGGKGANLGEMTAANFPIPPGFCVTAQAYFNYLEESGLGKKIIPMIDAIDVENTEQLNKVSAEVREIIRNTLMSDDLAIEIKRAYQQLGEKKLAWLTSSEECYVAIRSSATAEDLPEASFAGQQETYLNVKGQGNVVTAVQNCWASLFTARAVYYRKKQGFSTETVGISAVVQKMVDSAVAGVMFTASPTGDESQIVIEAAFGLGETVVSGAVTPDTYFIDKGSTKLLDKRVAQQEFKIVRKGKENIREKLSATMGKKQKLTDKQIIDIAKIGKQIERHYKSPQDIEWAVGNKEIYIVQSRAITTLGLKEKEGAKKIREDQAKKFEDKIILKGLPASPGLGVGKVKVIPSIDQITKVEKGDIIVTAMTSPDWVPTMKKAAAIITDEGGSTCHAAIVSRELGVPCVVGTSTGTKTLEDNEIVTVNGYDGVVYKGKVEIELPKVEEAEIIVESDLDRMEKVLEEELSEEKKPEAEKEIGVEWVEEENKEEEERKEELIERIGEARSELVEKAREKAEEIVENFGQVEAEEMPEEKIGEEKDALEELLEKIAVKVKVNVALPDAAEKAAATNAAGVGLLRAEHMITSTGKHPAEFIRQGEEEELKDAVKQGIRTVAEKFKGKPVWYRTFDARTDEFRQLEGGDKEPEEDNPMLGWHGIRRDLDEPEQLKAQFKAVKELRDEGLTNVGVMLAFVQSPKEFRKAKEIAKEAGLDPESKDFEFGVMVETPGAVWAIDELINEGIDFVSFGTNDLTQLTLGLDRNNERIQKLFTELHPAILRSIRHVIRKCRKAGVKTSICGQAASNPEMVKNLVRFGIDSVSANIDAVGKIKQTVLIEEKNLILEKRNSQE